MQRSARHFGAGVMPSSGMSEEEIDRRMKNTGEVIKTSIMTIVTKELED